MLIYLTFSSPEYRHASVICRASYGTKVCSNGAGHITKMVAMPMYGKTFTNLLLQNQRADDLETWYQALGAQVLTSLFK